MIIRFAVTEDDIAKGNQNDEYSCPIALAVRRCFGAECGVVVADTIEVTSYHYKPSVDDSDYWFDEDRNNYRFSYPYDSNIREFITAFDRGNEVKPFEATIEMEEV